MIQITIHLLSIISGLLKLQFQGQELELEAPSEKSQGQGAHFIRLVILTQVGILPQNVNLAYVFTPHDCNNQNGLKVLAFFKSKLNAPISQGFIDL